jgi:hypothetical protein
MARIYIDTRPEPGRRWDGTPVGQHPTGEPGVLYHDVVGEPRRSLRLGRWVPALILLALALLPVFTLNAAGALIMLFFGFLFFTVWLGWQWGMGKNKRAS